jgi:hypothetical protein
MLIKSVSFRLLQFFAAEIRKEPEEIPSSETPTTSERTRVPHSTPHASPQMTNVPKFSSDKPTLEGENSNNVAALLQK